MKKRVLALLLTLVMVLTMLPATAMAIDTETRDTKGYGGVDLPEGPDISGDVWTVTPENAQYTLDGAYGSINGKTIHFSTGDYKDVLELGRANKFSGSNTKYYSDNWTTEIAFGALQTNGVYRYSRAVEDVTFTADEGVVLPGFSAKSGHIYGKEGAPVYDYVRESTTESTVNSYYASVTLKNLNFDGLTISGSVHIDDYLENSLTDGLAFTGCTFQGNEANMADNGFVAIRMRADVKYYKNVTVTDCTFTDYFQGIHVQGPENWTIRNCSFDNTTHNAIALQSSTSNPVCGTITVEENVIQNTADRAVRLGNAEGASVVLENNIMLNACDSDGQMIKAEKLTNTDVSLDYNYWDGKDLSTAIAGGLTAPAVTGIRGGTFTEEIKAEYCAAGYEPVRQADGSYAVKLDGDGIFAGGSGTAADPYRIANATQLAAFRDSVNSGYSYAGEYVELTSNITLDGAFVPIREFAGVFDGNGCTISGYEAPVYASQKAYEDAGNLAYDGTRLFTGFFTNLNGGTVKNLTFADYTIPNSPVSNLTKDDTTENSVRNPSHIYVSVAVGMMQNGATLENVTVDTGTVDSQVRAAGLVAYVKNSGGSTQVNTIDRCVNKATVSTTRLSDTYGTAAGILSTTGCGYFTISDCENYGTISGYVAGGIAGDIQQVGSVITGCTNSGAINGKAFAGGILGNFWYGAGGTITNCLNTGAVQSWKTTAGQTGDVWKDVCVGGIIGAYVGNGQNKTTADITDCRNEGTVKHEVTDAEAHVGGILGLAMSGRLTMTNCVNTGAVTNLYYAESTADADAKPFRTGGIAGDIREGYNTLTDCISTGVITVDERAYYGNIVGYMVSTKQSDFWQDADDVRESANKVLYTELTEIHQPFGVLSPSSYSLLTVVNNIKADVMNIGGSSFYVYDTNGTASHIQGKYTYDLTGCEIGVLNRLNIGQTSGHNDASKATTVLKGVEVDQFVLFPKDDAPTWNYSLYYETVDGYIRSFVNNKEDRNFVYNGQTLAEDSGILDVAYFTDDDGTLTAKTDLTAAITSANGKPVTLINDVTATVSTAAVIYKNGCTATLTADSGIAITENGDAYVAYTTPSAETYTVVYEQEGLDGAYAEADKTENLAKDAVETALQKSYEGFTIASTKLDGTTYTVRYTRNSYTVTWDVDGAVTTTSCLYGGVIVKPADPVKSGYTFTGWEGYTDGMTMPAKNLTFTALWSRNGGGSSGSSGYNITKITQEGGSVQVSPTRPSKGTTVTITVTIDKGYALKELSVTDDHGNAVTLKKISDTKYTFTMPASDVTVLTTFRAVSTLPFTDVAVNDWFYDAVKYVYENGMMNGTTSAKFGPDAKLTRGMIVTILYRLEGEPEVSGSTFADVNPSQYYADPIAWAAKNGIVTGYDETTFGPEDSITREQLAAILYRYAIYQGMEAVTTEENLTGFTDADQVSAYAVQAMNWAVGEELITGVTTTTLNPKGTATRAQVATILMRFCENVAK